MAINMDIVGIMIAGILTIAIYSFLYKDNPAYKFAEHIFVGVTAGYSVCIAYYQVIMPNLVGQVKDHNNYWVLIPAFLGILMFSRFIPKISWVSRISIAFVIAVAAGVSVPNGMQATIIKQTSATIAPVLPIWDTSGFHGHPSNILIAILNGFHINELNNLIIILGVTTVLIYFFFSIDPGKGLKAASKAGIIFIMIFFGAQFGYTVMGRISLVIDRVWFMLKDWGPTVLHLLHLG
jgi:hypothetical protein